MHTKHIDVGAMACRIEYGGRFGIARLYTWNGTEALAECQQYGKLSDGTPTLCLTISTAFNEAEQQQCAAMLIEAWHEGSRQRGDQP